ncbi:MAG: hypothetical protein KC431_05485 [Myxococcales bacterium]|nr:hypothetical protein [Myxococcales bacterium]
MKGLYDFSDEHCRAIIDTRNLPLLIAAWGGVPTLKLVSEYFDAHKEVVEELAARGERCVMVTRSESAGRPPADVRQMITDRTAAIREVLNKAIVANAIVITNPLVRGAMTAIGWVDPSLRIPYLPSFAAGVQWAREEMAKHGLPVPDRLREGAVVVDIQRATTVKA